VDALLGPPDEWHSPLIRYRLSSGWQADWKEEVGHWLDTAERYGFLEPLRKRILKRAKQDLGSGAAVDPNDVLNRILMSELAEAMVTHYLAGTGWSFSRWQPCLLGADVDVALRTPSGTEALVQVKSTDQPGRVVGGRVMDGERDEHVVASAEKAARQLPKVGPEAKFVALCPNRSPLSAPWACLVPHLIGATLGARVVTLPRGNLGRFWAPEWKHVSGVLVLEMPRPVSGDPLYSCVALLNPVSDVRASADWFLHARVCVLEGDTFRWIRGDPGSPSYLPDGTRLTP
jgi:hypothetical protein